MTTHTRLRSDGRHEVAATDAANRAHGCPLDDWCILASGHTGGCDADREVDPLTWQGTAAFPPLPNHKIYDTTVIASVQGSDETPGGEWWVAMLLHPQPPYFEVAELHEDGRRITLSQHHNIVPAVREYEQNGGDY